MPYFHFLISYLMFLISYFLLFLSRILDIHPTIYHSSFTIKNFLLLRAYPASFFLGGSPTFACRLHLCIAKILCKGKADHS